MGLLKAGIGAATGVLADQWREYFYCESLGDGIIAAKGMKRTSRRSSNKRGEDNIISNGSIVAVNEGQCMMIVDQGEIVAFSSEPGEFVWENSTEPSIFYDGSEQGVEEAFNTFKKRFTMGGDTGKDQRVYFFNTKELMGNKYGTPNPVPFRVTDKNIGLDMDISVRCFGEYSYRLSNPILFYKNVCANFEYEFTVRDLESQLKSELMTALQPAFARISDMGIRYSSLPGHTQEIAAALNQVLSEKWVKLRGIALASFGVSSVKASEEDEDMIKQLQKAAVLRDPNMAAATITGAQADAMKTAAGNKAAGPMMAFAGMNMAANAGGINAGQLFEMGQQNRQNNAAPQTGAGTASQAGAGMSQAAGGWTCSCGAQGNTGRFCAECGKPKPSDNGWTCSCGAVNKGKFCTECGKPRPAGAKLYRCDKCGWEPEDPAHPPKFCPECGDRFDDGDVK